MKLKKIFTNIRVLILLVFLVLAVVAIYPNFTAEGVAIRNVKVNTSAAEAGIESPNPNSPPMTRERVIAINNQPIKDLADYYEIVSDLRPNLTITLQTNDDVYTLTTREKFETITLNETTTKVVEETYQETINQTLVNKTRNKTVVVNKTEKRSLGMEDLGLSVYDAPNSNIRKGLDLEGGTRVVLSPEEKLPDDTLDLLVSNLERRLNIYGLSDLVVRKAGDIFSDQQYIIVEIAGANEEEVRELLSKQGNFEAKIGGKVVFEGGTGDITYVCRSSDCSGIDPSQPCRQIDDQEHMCRFRFSIALKPEAAERQAAVTSNLTTITTDEQGNLLAREDQYLNETLDLFLDGQKVDSLNIGSDLKGRAVTDIQISGSGVGTTEQQASFTALENMKQMQTVLITGSLPVELNIEKTESLSPQLGDEFIKSAFLMGFLAIFAVAFVVYLRYRKIQVFVPMVITMVSEVVLILGMASLIGWNLDLAAIAGIIIAVGTGVDDQIVITDEVLRGKKKHMNWKTKIKNAFFIIMAAFFTTFVAMIPLVFAGAGILKGFAITTMLGISFGVFVTRPAFAAIMEQLLSE
ncbi:MAG: MMPL family transporter [Candidatus Woesearchaeota archaeon]